MAALRQAALAAITPDQVRAILAKMAELALTGDVQAAKLVLAYAIGRPAAAENPDRLDVDEWSHFKEAAPMLGEAGSLLTPEPAVLLDSVPPGRQAIDAWIMPTSWPQRCGRPSSRCRRSWAAPAALWAIGTRATRLRRADSRRLGRHPSDLGLLLRQAMQRSQAQWGNLIVVGGDS